MLSQIMQDERVICFAIAGGTLGGSGLFARPPGKRRELLYFSRLLCLQQSASEVYI